jgi:8-amino-7-oxononanoate synthase
MGLGTSVTNLRTNPAFEDCLEAWNREIREQGLWRELRCIESPQAVEIRTASRSILNFSSNDYLGFASHPVLRQAACDALAAYGCGSGASRLVCGSIRPHGELEGAMADYKGTEAALSFQSGYAAALGAISALVGPGDVIAVDRLVHASIIDAARLSRARLRVFAHNDLDDLEQILKWAVARPGAAGSRVLVVTESVFSMDGDLALLPAIVELKERYGAWLMVDEAHATGLFGARRSGAVEHFGLSGRVEIQLSTLGKALGSAGGCICGSRRLVDFLVNRARSFIFSTAPMPAAAAAAEAGIRLVRSPEGASRLDRLRSHVRKLSSIVSALPTPARQGLGQSAILPVVVGDEGSTMALSARLLDAGWLVPGIRYPTVARGAARLRITLSADHTEEHVEGLGEALRRAFTEEGQTR